LRHYWGHARKQRNLGSDNGWLQGPRFQRTPRGVAEGARSRARAAQGAAPVDAAGQARRRAEREARDAVQAEKRAAAKEARLQVEGARAEHARADEAAGNVRLAAQPTDEERKAARDAKYAARKKNKR